MVALVVGNVDFLKLLVKLECNNPNCKDQQGYPGMTYKCIQGTLLQKFTI